MRQCIRTTLLLCVATAGGALSACSSDVSCTSDDARSRLADAFIAQVLQGVQRDYGEQSAEGNAATAQIVAEFAGLKETARDGGNRCDGEAIATVRMAPAVASRLGDDLASTYLSAELGEIKISGDTLRGPVTYRIRRDAGTDEVESTPIRDLAGAAVGFTMQVVSEESARAAAH